MKKMKSYNKYKDSGVPWLGEVPEHWDVSGLRTILRMRNEKNNPIKTEQILSLSIAHGVTLYSHESRGGNKSKSDLSAYKIARTGDIVLNSMNVIVGAVGLSKYTGAISPVYYALYPARENVNITYYEKIFKNISFQKYLLIYGKGILIKKSESGKLNTIRMKISSEDLKNTYLPLPPLSEQQQIARYLDWKTSGINRFIKAKKKLIALLKEQKQNIINEAVTKGINPNVEMKDSGVEWLGKIPAHWGLRRIKAITKILRGKFSYRPRNEPSLYDGKYPFIQTGDVARADKYIISYKQTLNEKGYKVSKEFPKGTLTMTIAANIGDVAILNFVACFPDSIVGFVPYETTVEYLYYLFKSMKLELLKIAPVNTQGNLNIERVGSLYGVIPPIVEQEQIVTHIEKETSLINNAISKAEREIELIQEYRTRLVSDVVTGKVDVRSVVVPEFASVDEEVMEELEDEENGEEIED